MICSSCGTENEAGRRFCRECGAQLALACPTCGAPNAPGDKFCGSCGTRLEAEATAAPPAQPAAERRLVSVLFADLVGFTAASGNRDAEETRELLSRYFDTCRTLIERYGGTVEKFIGDAVMAVWGTPVAQEDDAERGVRAALELVAAVPELDPALQARAGVLTGEAAVTIGAQGQGMVAGDLVNTASRIQSMADPGAVLVGAVTMRASEAAVAYEEAGEFELKGKADRVPVWRALRVVAARGGALRSAGLEPPFVGRDRELRLVKDRFHACAEERRAHLVSVYGAAGIGKSRLAWEFFKYIDGLADETWWHRGRCLAYGEGVAYWALAEMVRMRAEIVEGEEHGAARRKLRLALDEHLHDPEERAWIEPRLAHLLGLEEHEAREREDLFAAWRLFFERLAETDPVVLVFEDTHWADPSLLEFLDYLLEWSRDYPIFILSLARPELVERHQAWAGAKRGVTSVTLEPLVPASMDALLAGVVPGLPAELRARILDHSEGVPLYAVEIVRMLLDRGLLERDGETYRPTGAIDALDVPESLHALIAARLDGFAPEERRLIQDASVLGKTFTTEAVSAVSGVAAVDQLLASLVRKEVFFVQSDPRSPERGQYGFLQDLLRRVAYETLAKKDRKARHLAAARYLESASGPAEQEIAEVVAAHYLEAYRLAPDAEDAASIKAQARVLLARAGERAASLAATEEAQHYFAQAAALADDTVVEAQLLEQAGKMAWNGGRPESRALFERAAALFEAAGQSNPAARVSAYLGEALWAEGHIDQAVDRMDASFTILIQDKPDADLAMLAAQLGRLLFFMGEPDRALERIEQALELAEALSLPEVLSQAMNTKGIVLAMARARPEEGLALISHALHVGLAGGVPSAALRAYYNLANMLYYRDQYEASLRHARDGLAYARRYGDRNWEWSMLGQLTATLFLTGDWDDALSRANEIPHLEDLSATEDATPVRFAAVELVGALPKILLARGQPDEAEHILRQFEPFRDSADLQERSAYAAASAAVLRSRGKLAEALAAGLRAFEARSGLGAAAFHTKMGFVEALEAALELADLATVDRLLEITRSFGSGERTPFLNAQAERFGALLAAARGDAMVAERRFKAGDGLLRETDTPFWLAVVLLEHGEWLVGEGRAEEAEPLVAEAREIFDRLGATPWLERVEVAHAGAEVAV